MKQHPTYPKAFLLHIKENLFFLFLLLCFMNVFAQTETNQPGWYLTNYSFKDGSLQNETSLMGTSSRMKNVISYKGDKGNIEITYNRYSIPDGKQLAGVTYTVRWTDPPAILNVGEKCQVEFELKTIASLSWKAPQQSINFNQGFGIYFVTPDGTKFITKDINTKLTTEKVIEKGTKGAKRRIQMNFGNGFAATYDYEWREGNVIAKPAPMEGKKVSGWHFTNYVFKDGSLQKETSLMGTSSRMKNVISYKGDKGNMEITYNRYSIPDGKQLAGVTYAVGWTDPPAVLIPGEKYAVDFELKTIKTLTWKAPQQSFYMNQGWGVYFVTPDGTKFITKDIKAKLTTEKAVEKGTAGAKRMIQMNFGNGFSATYNYEWKEF